MLNEVPKILCLCLFDKHVYLDGKMQWLPDSKMFSIPVNRKHVVDRIFKEYMDEFVDNLKVDIQLNRSKGALVPKEWRLRGFLFQNSNLN